MKGRDAVTADKTSVYARRFRVLAAAFLLLFFASFLLGRFAVAPGTLFRILLDALREWVCKLFGAEVPGELYSGQEKAVVLNIRLPRVALSALVGAGLSVAGTAYQGMFRNPMVSPDLLGASTGACFGAALAILFGASYAVITASSFLFGLAAVGLTYLVGRLSRIRSTLAMVLAGMMVGSLFSAGTSFIKLVADTTDQLPAITYWLMGSFTSSTYKKLIVGSPLFLIGIAIIFLLRWRLNILSLSEDEAKSSGIDIKKNTYAFYPCLDGHYRFLRFNVWTSRLDWSVNSTLCQNACRKQQPLRGSHQLKSRCKLYDSD